MSSTNQVIVSEGMDLPLSFIIEQERMLKNLKLNRWFLIFLGLMIMVIKRIESNEVNSTGIDNESKYFRLS